MIETVVIRHIRENLAKCSLTPLHDKPGFQFYTAHDELGFDGTGYTLLAVDAPELSKEDAGRPLLLLDATWPLLPAVRRSVVGQPTLRSIPVDVTTAYPRVNKRGEDPAGGLASVEALFIAHLILGSVDLSLLDEYYWRDVFIDALPKRLSALMNADASPPFMVS